MGTSTDPSLGPAVTVGVDAVVPFERVSALVSAATAHDGVAPLSEQSLLAVRHPGGAVRHVLATVPDASGAGGDLVGYAQVTEVPGPEEADGPDDSAGGASSAVGELVVHPRHRRRGVGRRLAATALDLAPGGRLRVWAHGDQPAAAALATALGFTRARVLFRMGRSLTDPLPAVELPVGVRLRPFEPGRDDARWLEVNARAFADHPEQGRWTQEDLALRQAEQWFDPAGFLLAVPADEPDATDAPPTDPTPLLGFHWTKVHVEPGRPPVGEVYVLGVDPGAQRSRLGRALTLAGLHHLADTGITEAILYVDESNPRAVALYTGLGFTIQATDVMYAATPSG